MTVTKTKKGMYELVFNTKRLKKRSLLLNIDSFKYTHKEENAACCTFYEKVELTIQIR